MWKCVVFIFTACSVWAQQSPQYSQYIKNQYMLNPAATGAYDFLDITLGGRLQWAGFDNAPKTSYLYFSAPVSELRRASMKRTYGVIRRGNKSVKHPKMKTGKGGHAVGGYLLADQYGAYRQLKAMGSYAFHIPLSRAYNLSLGVNAGIANRTFDASKAQVLSAIVNTGVNDPTYLMYAANQGAQYTMEMESGIYFYGKDVYLGVSANQLTQDFVMFGNRNINFDPAMHFFVSGGYSFHLNNQWGMTPAFLVKYVKAAPVSYDLSTLFDYQDRFWFGFSYRNEDAIVGMFGATFSNRFKAGYSYDFNINRFNRNSIGGHELVLGFMFR